MEKLTACIIVKNEEVNIEDCLKSLHFADEIIIVDSGSTDNTVGIVRKYTQKVIYQEWLGYSNQRNFAASHAANNWILSIDADERITDELAKEIMNILESPAHDVYDIPMRNYVVNRWMKHSGLGSQLHKRLYNRTKCTWSDQIHEDIVGYKSRGVLKNKMLHYAYKDVSSLVYKINLYTTIEASKYIKNKPNLLKSIFYPGLVFVKKYIFQLGFLDGRAGYLWAISLAYYHRLIFLKVRMK